MTTTNGGAIARNVPSSGSVKIASTFLGDKAAILLRGNGTVVPGASVAEATLKAIFLEEAAWIEYHASLLGGPRYYSAEELATRLAMDRAHEPARVWAHYAGRLRPSPSRRRLAGHERVRNYRRTHKTGLEFIRKNGADAIADVVLGTRRPPSSSRGSTGRSW